MSFFKPSPQLQQRRWWYLDRLIKEHGYKVGAELGVKRGTNTAYLLEQNPDLFMFCVDLWDLYPELFGREHYDIYTRWNYKEIFDNYQTRMKPFVGRVKTMRMKMTDAAPHFEDGSLDFIFIDGDHSYEGCLEDIRTWYPKVREGGMVTGHDINLKSVHKAVFECFAPHAVHIGPDQVWAVKRENSDNIYRKRPASKRD